MNNEHAMFNIDITIEKMIYLELKQENKIGIMKLMNEKYHTTKIKTENVNLTECDHKATVIKSKTVEILNYKYNVTKTRV